MEYVIITMVLVLGAISYIKLAQKYDIVDNPNFRSSHTIPTIRGGGILFFIAVLLYFITSKYQYPYFVLGLSSIALVSFIDDIVTLSAKIRLPFQFLAIGLLMYQLHIFDMNIAIIAIVAIIGVGFINVFNFMDGINGITGLYSIAVLGGLLVLNYMEALPFTNLLIYLLVSIVVFGYYNFRKKARLFAGDIGSIALAVAIFFVGLAIGIELQAPILLLLLAVYGVDGGLTILYRLSIREHIMEPHRHHIYQKLVDVWKWPHLKVAAVYAVLQLIVNVIIFVSYKFNLFTQLVITILCIFVLGLLYVVIFKKIKNTH